VAIKIYKPRNNPQLSLLCLQKEINVLKRLDHANVIKIIDFCKNAQYVKKNQKTYHVKILITELAPGGDVYQYISTTGNFSESLARTLFHQILEAIQYIHESGYAHRDIKLENILFDKNFCIKISDFGILVFMYNSLRVRNSDPAGRAEQDHPRHIELYGTGSPQRAALLQRGDGRVRLRDRPVHHGRGLPSIPEGRLE